MLVRNFFLVAITLSALSCSPKNEKLTIDDYNRAVSFMFNHLNNKKVKNLNIDPYWFKDSRGFWYLEYEEDAKFFKKSIFPNGETSFLFDHEIVAEELTNLVGRQIDPYDLPFNWLWERVDNNFRVTVDDKDYLINILDNSVIVDPEPREQSNPLKSVSPDGKWMAYTKNYNLYIESVETGRSYQLSRRGRKGYEFGTYYGWYDKMEGENGDRPERLMVNWSPDSKWIQTKVVDFKDAEKMYLLDWSKDELFKPRLLSYYRGSPGDTTMVKERPVFYNIQTRREIIPDLPIGTHVNGVSFRWHEDNHKVFAQYSKRGYQESDIALVDLRRNSITPLVKEVSETNIDNFEYRYYPSRNELLIVSERSGWRQLYRFDLETKTISPLTNGEYYVDQIVEFDKFQNVVYFTASDKEEGRNPYLNHLYSLDLESNEIRLLTPENAHHEVEFSIDNKYFFDNYSTLDTPTKSVLRLAYDGSIVKEIAEADITELEQMGWSPPEIIESIGRDGKTPIYGAMWKPSNFDPGKKYPVIDHSYTGPHTQMFPRNFRTVLARNNQALAELGFIVVMIDGMGSSRRSKEFHNYSYKNMGKNLTEHVSTIKELGEKYSWIDADRVGIFGHSAGGFDAGHAVLEFPDFYKVAVASSADHDFRMEKAWWPEMYMGWPVDSSYHDVSNITMAGNLKGKLLLVHGALDDNVNPSATFKLAEALVNADKQFDLLILPSQRHGYRGQHSRYFTKTRWNYFVEHLKGAEPIWEFDWE